MRFYPLRKKELSEIKDKACRNYPTLCEYLDSVKKAYMIEEGDLYILVLESDPAFITDKYRSELIPTILLVKRFGMNAFPYVVVDKGAVPHILNGADVMIPGIKELSDFNIGDTVAVWNIEKNAVLAVGKALMKSSDIKLNKKGKAIKTLHYAGDKIWKTMLDFLKQQKK
jgi:PUA-domain protein